MSDAPRIFILSPARLDGERAKLLFNENADSALARALRTREGVPIGEVFRFVSSLYFRGKLAYATKFARPPLDATNSARPPPDATNSARSLLDATNSAQPPLDATNSARSLFDAPANTLTHAPANALPTAPANTNPHAWMRSGALVMTANRGIIPVETRVVLEQLEAFAETDIDHRERNFRAPLERDARAIKDALAAEGQAVLLGSIASKKYVEPLLHVFDDRLLFPSAFVGRGDMSRGGLLLRAVEANTELDYAPVKGAIRHGARPPRLPKKPTRA